MYRHVRLAFPRSASLSLTPLSGPMVPPAGCCGDRSDLTSRPYSFSFPSGKSGLKIFYTISSSSLRSTNSILGDAFFYVLKQETWLQSQLSYRPAGGVRPVTREEAGSIDGAKSQTPKEDDPL